MHAPDERNTPCSVAPGDLVRRLLALDGTAWSILAIVVQTGIVLATGILLVVDQGQPTGATPLRVLGHLTLFLIPAAIWAVWFLVQQQGPRAMIDYPYEAQAANVTARIEAILKGQMLLTAFQPIRSLQSGTWIGAEALTRFPESPHATPEECFAEAESVGLGVELEILAVESALNTSSHLPASVYVAINVSPGACLDPRLKEALEKSGVPLHRIVLEVTERHEVADYAPLAAALLPLRHGGVRMAVDDAGAGFASMRHILQLKPDMVKLDREIIAGIDSNPGQRALSAAMAGFSAEIGATLVAEGVETVAELKTVSSLGIGAAQGYLLGSPTTKSEDWEQWPVPWPESIGSCPLTAAKTTEPPRAQPPLKAPRNLHLCSSEPLHRN